MGRPICFVRAALLATSTISFADEIDSVRKELHHAVAAHEKDESELETTILRLFDEREASARERGDKKAVEAVNAERTKFVESGNLPGWAPLEQIMNCVHSRTRMIEAFELGVKAYTKDGHDEKATEVELERAAFDANPRLLMSFEHEVRDKRGKSRAMGAIRLYSNMTAESDAPNVVSGKSIWSLRTGGFEFRWADPKAASGFHIDRVRLSRDGLSYNGKNLTSGERHTRHGKRIGAQTD